MRKSYLDNIRWITVVLVVIYHVLFMYNSIETDLVIGPFSSVQYQDAFLYLVYPWFMLLLFVVSGMSSRYYLNNHTGKEYIQSRTRKLLVPSTIGLFVFQWIQGYFSMSITDAFANIPDVVPAPVLYVIMVLSGQGVLWFAQLLWFFSLLLPLVRKIEKDKFYNLCGKTNIIVLLLLTIVVFGAAQVLNVPMIIVYRLGIYGFGFFVGYFVMSHDEVMERLEKYWFPLTIVACGLGVAFTIVYFGEPYAQHVILDTPLCNVFAWIAVLAVLAFMKKWGNVENAFSKWMSKKSWGLYVFHYTAISACAFYLHKFASGAPAIVCYLSVALAAFAGSFAVYEIISRIPVVRWCVLGIKKTKSVNKERSDNHVEG